MDRLSQIARAHAALDRAKCEGRNCAMRVDERDGEGVPPSMRE